MPKQLDEKVATLHRPTLGTAITVCAQEHTAYIGVKLEGSFAQCLSSFSMFDATLSPLRLRPGIHWHPSWSITLLFLRIDNKHVLLVLGNPVWCGFTLTPSFGIPKKSLVGFEEDL